MKFNVMLCLGMMERLIPIPILLAPLVLISYCGVSSSALEHKCIHDTEEMQTLFYGPIVDNVTGQREAFTPEGILKRTVPQQYIPMPPPDAPDEVHRAFHATAIGNIRIKTSTRDLEISGQYCTKRNDVVPDFRGEYVRCKEEDIFTNKKRRILLNNILPAAINLLSSALKVNQVQGNLLSKGCRQHTIPPFNSIRGVPDADFVLYVSVGPIKSGALAWASLCNLDGEGRPIDGVMNLGPKEIVWDNRDPYSQQELVRTAAHEILHALGFTDVFWPEFPRESTVTCKSIFCKSKPTAKEKRRGKRVKYFKSSKVVEKAREYFNCPTLKGPELEDEGDGGSIGSHWKGRNHKDDIMAPVGSRLAFLSHITLAVMEDSGHYIIDWSKAETPSWMYKAGCGVFTEKCSTTAGGMGKYFCDDGDNKMVCTPDHRAVGDCVLEVYNRQLPKWAHYFPDNLQKGGQVPFMDYCPIVWEFPQRQCDNPTNTEPNTTIIPNYYGTDGRCFESYEVIKLSDKGTSRDSGSCLRTKCVGDTVQFMLPDYAAWIPCPSMGETVVLSKYGYKGRVICPDPRMICANYN